MSITDILETNFKKGNTKLYFKVNLFDAFGDPERISSFSQDNATINSHKVVSKGKSVQFEA